MSFRAASVSSIALSVAPSRSSPWNLPLAAAMAFRAAGVLALLCAGRASGDACPGSTEPMMETVTGMAPACFEACPQVCGEMEALINEYTTTWDRAAVEVKLCANREPFTCFFGEGRRQSCLRLVDAASEMGVALPATRGQMESHCKALAAGGNSKDEGGRAPEASAYYDMPPGNTSSEATTTHNAPDAANATGPSSSAECRTAMGATSVLVAMVAGARALAA
eukprot:CAMPEP_0170387390 /NCGR_PEP_ID=MMETSP0117_2-20130122/17532_1 /TAXON_ID=400756 /ORGANISM="Durinskia baltica, Strain CSIRO CS-38" /LENGTH=222 /DNA_ID=CAMNT_0010643255 /DNA_START=59 /DNA_END=727 /DNA_ORIENTATION=-